jgi:hypothetical protein
MRLMDWRQIRAEKIRRGRTWQRSQPGFPKPKVKGTGRGGDLYDEAEIDAWLARFVAVAAIGDGPAGARAREEAVRNARQEAERRTAAERACAEGRAREEHRKAEETEAARAEKARRQARPSAAAAENQERGPASISGPANK